MPTYNIGFCEKLIEAARYVFEQEMESVDAQRTVLYLSRLACEIILKALLEKAGRPITEIRKHNHNLSSLLRDVDKCKVRVEVVKNFCRWTSATRLRAITVDSRFSNATVGTFLTAEERGSSKYPNEIRYGSSIEDYPPGLVLKTAALVMEWSKTHWEDIKLQSTENGLVK